MTAPRQVLPRTTYLVTRRCLFRQFLLTPSRTANDVFLYLLAVAARRYGVHVHAYCVMSNHYHVVVTDPGARLPAFLQFLHALIARAMNGALGRRQNFWDPKSYSAVPLRSKEDIVDKAAYVLANPAAAGLVRSGRIWPGLWSDPDRFGTAMTIAKPKGFFDANGSLPAVETLELTAPPGFDSFEEFKAQTSAALAEREAQAVARHRGRFLGVAAVLAQKPTKTPRSPEPLRSLNPRVAARDTGKRLEEIGKLLEFRRAYRAAWDAYRAGEVGVVFPSGTYLMRVLHGVPCAGVG